jgi:hypothetical protein
MGWHRQRTRIGIYSSGMGMTVATPGADHCCLCALRGVLEPAVPTRPGAPCCRACIEKCGGTVEDMVIDFSAARARLRTPRCGAL